MDQDLAAVVVEARAQRTGDRLGLHRGVDADPLETLWCDRLAPLARGDGLLEQQLDAGRTDRLPPAHQRARVDRQGEP
jgi:hypothetical protein